MELADFPLTKESLLCIGSSIHVLAWFMVKIGIFMCF